MNALAHRTTLARWDDPDRALLELDVITKGSVASGEDANLGAPGRHVPQPEEPVRFRADPWSVFHASESRRTLPTGAARYEGSRPFRY
jgi:hypothetical protein